MTRSAFEFRFDLVQSLGTPGHTYQAGPLGGGKIRVEGELVLDGLKPESSVKRRNGSFKKR